MSTFKRILVLSLLVFMSFAFISCEGDEPIVNEPSENIIKVGILQLATHGALDSARDGFIEGLKEAGYEVGKNIVIKVSNPENDTLTMNQMASDLVRSSDIVLGIATPAAQALQAAAESQGLNIPILFTAVTDAVAADLVESNEKPGGHITGTNDMNPVSDQIDLIKEILPTATTFGIIYNIDEVNSRTQAKLAKEEAKKEGLSVIEKTVSDPQLIEATVRQMITEGAKAIYLPTDNLIAKNIAAVINVCEEYNVPTICGEEAMVKEGGSITYGVNYFNLGKQTGQMAVKILNGADPASMPVESQPASQLAIAYNEESFKKIGLEVPESIKNRK